MKTEPVKILLADDSKDDRFFFQESLKSLDMATELTTVDDGVQLLSWLQKHVKDLPDVLFLDLNMPLMNGEEALTEIKLNKDLRALPVIMFSTAIDDDTVKRLYNIGAQYYLIKPSTFSKLAHFIEEALVFVQQTGDSQPPVEEFVIDH